MKSKSKKGLFFSVMLCVMVLCCSMFFSQNVEAKTKKVSITKKATIKVGKKKKIQLKNNKKKVKWSVKNKKIAKMVKTSKQYAIIRGSKAGKTKVVAKVGKKKYTCTVTVKKKNSTKDNNVSDGKYSYSVKALLPPFNDMFYVKTDNPNPKSIRFVDKKSRYYTSTDDIGYIVPCRERFYDVEYENKQTGRVKGGYIFIRSGGSIDGGQLTMQVLTDEFSSKYADTKIVVNCESVKSPEQYLVDKYTDSTMTFFEKMDSVQQNLDKIAIYPRTLLDSNKKSSGTPYPFLATSPYPELSLNAHYEIYEYSEESLLTKYLYPFDISSLGFPSMMYSAAEIMEPSCKVEWGDFHYLVNVTYKGETHTYGGAGNGENSPIYTKDVTEKYLFNDSGSAPVSNVNLDKLKEKLLAYGVVADERQRTLEGALEGTEFVKKIGTGSWLRVGSEPYWVGYAPRTVYTYVSGGFMEDSTENVEEAWVDGRYVNVYNQLELGAKFEDYPTADIVLRNQSYTNASGEQKYGDIYYRYYSDSDTWKAVNTYFGRYWYTVGEEENMPEQFVLTREKVAQLGVDRNTDKLPESGLIYDSSVLPGTAFNNNL